MTSGTRVGHVIAGDAAAVAAAAAAAAEVSMMAASNYYGFTHAAAAAAAGPQYRYQTHTHALIYSSQDATAARLNEMLTASAQRSHELLVFIDA